jgi:hypothetical protein
MAKSQPSHNFALSQLHLFHLESVPRPVSTFIFGFAIYQQF